jgi:hypothetical protein
MSGLNAQRKGWAVCPTKSLSARQIEDSVIAQIKAKQVASFEREQMDATQRIEAVQIGPSGNRSPGCRSAKTNTMNSKTA